MNVAVIRNVSLLYAEDEKPHMNNFLPKLK